MGTLVKNTADLKKSELRFGARHVQSIMLFLGITFLFSVRASMSLAIVAMTGADTDDSFDWSIQRQGVILSSFNWGYIVLMVFSGELASRFGGMTLITLSVGVNALTSLVLPFAAFYGDWILVCICRGIQGMMQGTIFPTTHYLIGKWIPLNEKGRICSFVYAGAQFGTAAQLIISGFLANYFGWSSIFYVNGVFGLVWVVTYLFLGSDNPQVSKRISAEERYYIQSSLGQIGGHKRLKTPWKAISISIPFLAGVIANIGYNWGHWTLLSEIPTYMSEIVHVNIKANGAISALPYLIMFTLNFPVGFASDFAINKSWISVTAARKIFNSIGFFGPAIGLIVISYVPTANVSAIVVLLCLIIGLNAGCYNGYGLVYLDMAPNFSSQLMAVSNFISNIVAMFAPLTAGFILKDQTNAEEWRIIFYISAIIYICTNIIFLIFGTSKIQDWNEESEIQKNNTCA